MYMYFNNSLRQCVSQLHRDMFKLTLFLVVFECLFVRMCAGSSEAAPRKITGVRFLVTVNDTWADPPGCIQTVATPVIEPGKKSGNIPVGSCDNGPLEYSILSPGKNNNLYTVRLTFHSSVIVDASPPTCELSWNGTYLVPGPTSWTANVSLLPACFTQDSREGYHMTSYWFQILDWFYDERLDTVY